MYGRKPKEKLKEKLKEALAAIGPILIIVLLLGFSIAPIPGGVLLAFLLGSFLLVIGEMLFSLGAELAMEPMGERMGSSVTKTRNLPLILGIGFLLGFLITISEPDLMVLAGQVQAIPSTVMIIAVAIGVGFFLVIGFLQKVFSIPFRMLLILSYLLVFILSLFAPDNFLAIAFDAGGVTTGPMTVPFILSFGVGISAIRNDKRAVGDSLGLVAVCSVGPILTVLILSLIYRPEVSGYTETIIPEIQESISLGRLFLSEIPTYLAEMARSLLPIVVFFGIYQCIFIRLDRRQIYRIVIGLLYTYVGLVLFLTGANVGFMPAGLYLGKLLAGLPFRWIIVPIGMIIGFFVVKAEPAVCVLMRQVEDITDGAIPSLLLQRSLCVGMALSVGLALLRVLTGTFILWLILPGYLLALLLSFVTPDIFTAIAFDSGGVATGPVTATFLLPLAIGACLAVGGNVITDAFGVVSMAAMTPLITIQLLGLIYRLRGRKKAIPEQAAKDFFADLDEYAIIEL